ncbi:hypothetical protein F3Y22_tig00110983pilonHSYRG00018 [Hibiscus syriacus]|uniref:RING-type E3 ubiquitin transferase n=1 Tax=Hibiscus syriacus TaxID=106335 RepID=A0A6A2ZBW7_HIBSY|nr:hypothetical protein F3Y22_tig00110983pilonHSYRG00018 [Hibiscus syriacus]
MGTLQMAAAYVLNRKASICTRKEHFDNDKEDQVLTSLFEEIKETSSSTMLLPHNSLHHRDSIESVLCVGEGDWSGIGYFAFELLNVTADIREQVELLHKQVKRVELFVDPSEVQQRDELLRLMAYNNDKNNRCPIDFKAVKHVFSSIGLRGSLDYEEEISKLEAEAQKQAVFVFSINVFNIPDEFRCPISLNWMKDPVIVASGHTYDRNSIAQWINNGHHTCPKSGQRLIHMALIPNYALKSLVHQWCQENNIPITECSSNVSESEINSKQKASEKTVDHISATKVAIDSVKMTAEFLVGKLAMGSLDIQRQAAYELSRSNRQHSRSVGIGKNHGGKRECSSCNFSLSMIDDFKVAIGAHARAIPALIGLLREGTMTGKKGCRNSIIPSRTSRH